MTRMRSVRAALALLGICAALAAGAEEGKQVYEQRCAMCHAAAVGGAPRPGNAGDWSPRLRAGKTALYRSAMQGTAKGMPPRGGHADLSERAIRAAVDYMIGGAGAASKPAAATTMEVALTSADQPMQPATAAVVPGEARATAAALPEPGSGASRSNAFNRLLKSAGKRNLPPAEDGIHDASVDGTLQLQPPLASFNALPRSNAGNRVDWVKALEHKRIEPRWDRDKPEAGATVMDLNIVREVKGSMPDVVYPHKQHTEWLDCSNCHPAIFVPQKGANQMSMAAILLGRGCGTCHGKVAFPVSECRLCHSRKKDGAAQVTQPASPAGRQ